jgi:hypothetical protein
MLEVGSSPTIDRAAPVVDGIQNSYLLTYKESYVGQGDLHRAWITSFALDHSGQPQLLESRVPLGGLATPEAAPVATDYGHYQGGIYTKGFEVVWDEPMPPSGRRDVFGARFQSSPTVGWVNSSCFGDGSDSRCPCGNNPGVPAGCPNSTEPLGGQLTWTGHANTQSPTLTVHAQRLPAGVTVVLVQGDAAQHPAFGYGAGLLCSAGTRTDIVIRSASDQEAFDYPAQHGDLPISTVGGVPATGGLRIYQVVYRDSLGFCTSVWNTTNALEVHWSN